jgi:hypothetical protein
MYQYGFKTFNLNSIYNHQIECQQSLSLPTNPDQYRGQGSGPRRWLLPAVESAQRVDRIGQITAILQKTLHISKNQPIV